MTNAQIMRNGKDLCALVPEYMIKRIRFYINGDLIGEMPPENIIEPMPHWFTFISTFFNIFNRPCSHGLSIPGRFLPTEKGEWHVYNDVGICNDYFWFDNTKILNSLIRNPLTRTDGWTIETYKTVL